MWYSLELPQQGSSNKYSQSMLSSRNKKSSAYLCKPKFYYTKVGFKGGQNYLGVFRDVKPLHLPYNISLNEISKHYSIFQDIVKMLTKFASSR